MELQQKKTLKLFLSFLVVANTLLFLVMAYFHLLSTDPKSAVFVDFWGRFTVYSLWFIGFALYVKYVSKTPVLRLLVLLIIAVIFPYFCFWLISTKLVTHPI